MRKKTRSSYYASFLYRFLALVIDLIIFTAIEFTVSDKNSYINFALFILFMGYFIWMNGKYGGTIGKMVLGIRITKENSKRINYSDALIRQLASYLSVAILLLGYLSILWDKKNQAWHDKIAKTIVVYT